MEKSEFLRRALQLAFLIGILVFIGAQLAPFDLAKRQGISFGLLAALSLRSFYIIARDGWDAADEAANNDGGIFVVTLILCAVIATPY